MIVTSGNLRTCVPESDLKSLNFEIIRSIFSIRYIYKILVWHQFRRIFFDRKISYFYNCYSTLIIELIIEYFD